MWISCASPRDYHFRAPDTIKSSRLLWPEPPDADRTRLVQHRTPDRSGPGDSTELGAFEAGRPFVLEHGRSRLGPGPRPGAAMASDSSAKPPILFHAHGEFASSALQRRHGRRSDMMSSECHRCFRRGRLNLSPVIYLLLKEINPRLAGLPVVHVAADGEIRPQRSEVVIDMRNFRPFDDRAAASIPPITLPPAPPGDP